MPLVLMILGFIWWWPLGLLILGYLIARHKFGYWRRPMYAGNGPMSDWDCHMDRWEERWDRKMARMQEKMERVRDRMERYRSRGGWFGSSSSGNRAFDDYRSETLKRLEEEQREFKEFLERLRFAKDRPSSTSSWPRAASARSKRPDRRAAAARRAARLIFVTPSHLHCVTARAARSPTGGPVLFRRGETPSLARRMSGAGAKRAAGRTQRAPSSRRGRRGSLLTSPARS